MRVALFVPCYVDQINPEVGVSVVRVLRRLGVDVIYPEGQTCCGQPAFNSGFFDEARTVARHFMDVFERESERCDYVVCPSGSCTTMVSHYYPFIFEDLPDERERSEALGARVREFSDFLVNVMGARPRTSAPVTRRRPSSTPAATSGGSSGCWTSRASCWRNVEGLDLVGWENEELCCGFGGTFSVKMPDVSTAMADEKIKALDRSGADTLISGDSSCLMHLKGRLRRTGHDTRVLHLAQVLDPKNGRLKMETEKPDRRRETKDRRHEGIASAVEGFNERGRKAAEDQELHDSVELFTGKAVAARNAVLHALPEAPELRERAYRIKQETMANLDRYLEQMADNVEARGGNVFFAEDGEAVVRYIGDLARSKGAKVITKSKSMATEEIELNRRLEEDYADLDLEIVETDLGEWIAQLAGDHPSHIVGPILHMNRKRITEVLSQTAGEKLPPDVEALGSFARKRLREKFLTADIGITGANFGVAETGTIATVTNEGNARLVTSVPPVHVVVMGIEKLIPRFEDLSVFTRLLARSGTGQKLTVYTNFITGPRGDRASSTGRRSCTSSSWTTAAPSCSARSSRRPSTASAAAPA